MSTWTVRLGTVPAVAAQIYRLSISRRPCASSRSRMATYSTGTSWSAGTAKLRLIDYDGMWVPALKDRISNEKGVADYQHPGRTWEHYGQGMDRFALLVLFLTTLAIERHPEIWQASARSEGLLLRAKDFREPDESETLGQLAAYSDLAPYVRRFRRACVEPVTGVPSLPSSYVTLRRRRRLWRALRLSQRHHRPCDRSWYRPSPKSSTCRSSDLTAAPWMRTSVSTSQCPVGIVDTSRARHRQVRIASSMLRATMR